MAPGLVVSRSSEYSTLLFHGPQSRSQHSNKLVGPIGYTGGTCEYFAVLKMSCKLNGDRVSTTQVDLSMTQKKTLYRPTESGTCGILKAGLMLMVGVLTTTTTTGTTTTILTMGRCLCALLRNSCLPFFYLCRTLFIHPPSMRPIRVGFAVWLELCPHFSEFRVFCGGKVVRPL